MSEFSFATVENFIDHISKSIPSYSQLIDYIVEITRSFAIMGEEEITAIDLGASTGDLLKLLQEEFPDASLLGYDIEPNMVKNSVFDEVVLCDITHEPIAPANIFYSIFTLQFLRSTKDRQYVMKKVYDSLPDRGAFIVAEKVLSENTLVHDILRNAQIQYKREHFTDEEILDKERSLRRIMRPTKLNTLINELTDAGFENIEPFWCSGQFIALLCIKEE